MFIIRNDNPGALRAVRNASMQVLALQRLPSAFHLPWTEV